MAHFYGEVEGQSETPATRCGSKSSGLRVRAASHRVSATVYIDEIDGEDRLTVSVYKGNIFSDHCEKLLDKKFTTDMVVFQERG